MTKARRSQSFPSDTSSQMFVVGKRREEKVRKLCFHCGRKRKETIFFFFCPLSLLSQSARLGRKHLDAGRGKKEQVIPLKLFRQICWMPLLLLLLDPRPVKKNTKEEFFEVE